MERNYNVSGADRKQLVKAIGDALGTRPKYMGTPSFAFRIGSYEVTKHGVLIFEKDEQTASVLAAIDALGFVAEQSEREVLTDGSENDAEEIPQEEGTQITGIEAMAQTTEEHIMEESAPIESQEDIINLSISMPRENFSDTALANLDALLKSKGNLIKAAFDIEEANYTLTEERITFAWFHGTLTSEAYRAYADFIGKLCDMARRQKRVLAKEKEVDNPKYAFRCFLLRLGLIGNKYKTSRKILLQNLWGNSAFKCGHRKGDAVSITDITNRRDKRH
nr:MAG TPA: hypothetical protein [Caudoviricetes sp.]